MHQTTHTGIGTLFLIPNFLSPDSNYLPVPAATAELTKHIVHFAVESDRPARKLLAKMWGIQNLNHLDVFVLDGKKQDLEAEQELISLLKKGTDVGLISDAGYPSVGDPGESLVLRAHKAGVHVKPLIGPNSFMMALCASGLNAEKFTFHGYLPKEKAGRISRLRELEQAVKKTEYTQIFMETPYRNRELIKEIIQTVNPELMLSIAWDITGSTEEIKTRRISEWKSNPVTDELADKRPAVFVLGNG